mmetsp:Transcript_11101/g.16881  ORF Transcript_11101/g.16881 Transcript_11101/m.16881 type:complete len:262 (-) Transcript_11101:300-1085(-)
MAYPIISRIVSRIQITHITLYQYIRNRSALSLSSFFELTIPFSHNRLDVISRIQDSISKITSPPISLGNTSLPNPTSFNSFKIFASPPLYTRTLFRMRSGMITFINGKTIFVKNHGGWTMWNPPMRMGMQPEMDSMFNFMSFRSTTDIFACWGCAIATIPNFCTTSFPSIALCIIYHNALATPILSSTLFLLYPASLDGSTNTIARPPVSCVNVGRKKPSFMPFIVYLTMASSSSFCFFVVSSCSLLVLSLLLLNAPSPPR